MSAANRAVMNTFRIVGNKTEMIIKLTLKTEEYKKAIESSSFGVATGMKLDDISIEGLINPTSFLLAMQGYTRTCREGGIVDIELING